MNRSLIPIHLRELADVCSFAEIILTPELRLEGICKLYGESVLVQLQWIHCCKTGEPLSSGVDDIQVTIRTIVPPETYVGACALFVHCVHLQDRRE